MTPARKVGFVLLSPSADPLPSTRVSVLNMLPWLARAGLPTCILHDPTTPTETPDVGALAARARSEGCAIVYFQKVRGRAVERAVAQLQALDIRTVYGACDLVEPDLVSATDMTLAVTDFLKQLHPPALWHKIRVVHDGIERPAVARTQWDDRPATAARPLRCVLVTSASLARLPALPRIPRWLHVTIVGRYPTAAAERARQAREVLATAQGARAKWEYLRFRAHPRIALVPWHPDRVYDALLAADVGILPIARTEAREGAAPAWQVKSENRLTLKMAAGLPVVATPIPSYRPIVHHGRNAYFADDATGWMDALTALRAPDVRERLGRAARNSVIDAYSQEAQARLLIAALSELSARQLAATP